MKGLGKIPLGWRLQALLSAHCVAVAVSCCHYEATVVGEACNGQKPEPFGPGGTKIHHGVSRMGPGNLH